MSRALSSKTILILNFVFKARVALLTAINGAADAANNWYMSKFSLRIPGSNNAVFALEKSRRLYPERAP